MKIRYLSLVAVVFFGIMSIIPATALSAKSPKYVFVFVGDGLGSSQRMAADQYLTSKGEPGLIMNALSSYGMITTYQNDRFITDSAAAGTALATGVKTNGGYISVDPKFKSVATIAEKAKKMGMKVGIVSSVTINHATPAVFYSHQKSRNLYYEIGMDLANSGFDYFGGGGPVDPEGKRSKNPKGSVLDLAKMNGYKIVSDRNQFLALKKGSGKIFAFKEAGQALPYVIDTKPSDITLVEFTKKGIELLDNDKGFFMMVEGGKIDWACHANDAVTAIKDTLEFDKSLKVAYDFYKKHPKETLIVVVGDHETGGLTLGFAGTKYDSFFEVLDNQKVSYDAFSGVIFKQYKEANKGKASFKDMLPLLKEYFGLVTSGEGNLVLKDFEIEALQEAFIQSMSGVKVQSNTADYLLYGGYDPFTVQITHIINQKAGLAWTSYSHTGVPVPVSAAGAGSANFSGYYDNTGVGKKLLNILN
jgi:alkaline phosphatase